MRLIHWRMRLGRPTLEEKLQKTIAALPTGKISRAMRNRLEKLAHGQKAPGERASEVLLFDKLVELGLARRETARGTPILGIPYTWDIYYITDAGREELARCSRR